MKHSGKALTVDNHVCPLGLSQELESHCKLELSWQLKAMSVETTTSQQKEKVQKKCKVCVRYQDKKNDKVSVVTMYQNVKIYGSTQARLILFFHCLGLWKMRGCSNPKQKSKHIFSKMLKRSQFKKLEFVILHYKKSVDCK